MRLLAAGHREMGWRAVRSKAAGPLSGGAEGLRSGAQGLCGAACWAGKGAGDEELPRWDGSGAAAIPGCGAGPGDAAIRQRRAPSAGPAALEPWSGRFRACPCPALAVAAARVHRDTHNILAGFFPFVHRTGNSSLHAPCACPLVP